MIHDKFYKNDNLIKNKQAIDLMKVVIPVIEYIRFYHNDFTKITITGNDIELLASICLVLLFKTKKKRV